MPTSIKRVAIAGANGNAGSPIFKALLESKLFDVTVLTRKDSDKVFPPEVTVKKVDYTNVAELTDALRGQDALVNATFIGDAVPQINLVDAAIAAGVYRYLPSEYGLDTSKPSIGNLPIFAAATAGLKHMHERCGHGGGAPGATTTYTEVCNGGFLDWCLETGFLGILPRARSVTVYDEGDHEIAYTTREWAGRAVVGVLTHPDETANRAVFVANVYASQLRLAALAREELGPDGWTEDRKSLDGLLAGAMARVQAGDFSIEGMLDLIKVADLKYETRWEKDDNELLGIPRFSDADVKAVIRANS